MKKKSLLMLMLALLLTCALCACGGTEGDAGSDEPATLEDYINSNDEAKESLMQAGDTDEGMTVEVKENTVIYSFQYDETYEPDAVAYMAEQFETYMDSNSGTFEEIASMLEEESKIDGVIVRVVYLNGDGKEIYDREFEAK